MESCISLSLSLSLLQCAPEGRQGDDQQLLFIKDQSVKQIGDDPILVLDDVM